MSEASKGIVVYCASSAGVDQKYFDFAREVGREIARAGYPVVSGGGRGGLMAAVIEGALEEGGETVGVLPRFMMERDWNHPQLSETITTESMHERKMTMANRSIGAIALPGGVGTLDELFEIITWRQLGLYKGNVVIANACGYYDLLLEHLRRSGEEHFMRTRGLWTVADTPAEAVRAALSDVDFEIVTKY